MCEDKFATKGRHWGKKLRILCTGKRTLKMNLIKFFIVFTLLAIAGGGCKSSTSEVSGITKITDGCSLGKFFFSLDDFGEIVTSNDSEVTWAEELNFQKKIHFGSEEFLLIEYGVFRSPYFDWKENPKELIVHFWIAANEKEAQKAGKAKPNYYQHGKFIIIADGKNHQLYLDNFLKLLVDAQGNLEISPLRINADIYKFPETGSLRIVYSWPDSMK